MKDRMIYFILLLYTILATGMIFLFDGTGDSGDSILHYLYAKYAPLHPELYFNHWAKPLYVLIASPFAQFGFIGLKVMNVICVAFTIYFTYRSAQKLEFKNSLLVPLILICSPYYFVLTFSGLTEPLFALFLSLSLYLALNKKYLSACILISFLPFVRSEGLIFIGVFGIYVLIKKDWKLIPFLLFGHLLYSLAGTFFHQDLLWVFNKIPYAQLSSNYGSGQPFHFVEQLLYVFGLPLYVLFWLGSLVIIWKIIKTKIALEFSVLVFFGFMAFFIAHTIFWNLGIFNSMGLNRVFIGVIPLASLIILEAYNFVCEDWFQTKRSVQLLLKGILIAYIFIFPLAPHPAAIHWDKEMNLSGDQLGAKKVADFIQSQRKGPGRLIYAHPYLSEALGIDHFDTKIHLELHKDVIQNAKPGDKVIWENWYAPVESGITKEFLDQQFELTAVYTTSTSLHGHQSVYVIYERR